MSEHIKEGRDIFNVIAGYKDKKDKDEKWVSLSWLREKIKKERDTPHARTFRKDKKRFYALDWVLSLLEETP